MAKSRCIGESNPSETPLKKTAGFHSGDVLLIDSQNSLCSLATLASLTVYPPASQHDVFARSRSLTRYPRGLDRLPYGFPARRVLCSSRRRQTKRPALLTICWALCSGDVLLSHGLSPYYHRGCSVSLPCSEWERVVPLRYCHQKRNPKQFGVRFW